MCGLKNSEILANFSAMLILRVMLTSTELGWVPFGFGFVSAATSCKNFIEPSAVRTVAHVLLVFVAVELPCFLRRFLCAEIVLIWPQRIPFPRCFHAATPFPARHRTVYLILFVRRARPILQRHEPWPRREP